MARRSCTELGLTSVLCALFISPSAPFLAPAAVPWREVSAALPAVSTCGRAAAAEVTTGALGGRQDHRVTGVWAVQYSGATNPTTDTRDRWRAVGCYWAWASRPLSAAVVVLYCWPFDGSPFVPFFRIQQDLMVGDLLRKSSAMTNRQYCCYNMRKRLWPWPTWASTAVCCTTGTSTAELLMRIIVLRAGGDNSAALCKSLCTMMVVKGYKYAYITITAGTVKLQQQLTERRSLRVLAFGVSVASAGSAVLLTVLQHANMQSVSQLRPCCGIVGTRGLVRLGSWGAPGHAELGERTRRRHQIKSSAAFGGHCISTKNTRKWDSISRL